MWLALFHFASARVDRHQIGNQSRLPCTPLTSRPESSLGSEPCSRARPSIPLFGKKSVKDNLVSFSHPVQIGSGNEILYGMNVADFAGAQDELLGLFAIAFAQSVLACKE
jgi:hypothetical protein